MASTNGNNISAVEEKIEKLELSDEKIKNDSNESKSTKIFEPHLSGFEMRELYKIALNFYKEKEGKAVHLSYEDKLKLVAFTQQVTHGKCTAENAPPLGVLDVIGKDRRLAWQNLGDITKDEAMEGFVVLLDKLCPLFKTVVEALKRDIEEKKRLQKEEEVKKVEEEKRLKELEEEKEKEEEERLKQENQRRQIQEALNQQTYHQFRAYAEQQYPGNPEQQGVLIRQLQEQHYHKYMQQLHQNQILIEDHEPLKGGDNSGEMKIKETEDAPLLLNEEGVNEEDSDEQQDWPPIEPSQMWTKEGVEDFKNMIKKEAGDAVIKVGHGKTITVRVPTQDNASCLFWEFATDGYDIGFGVYFEWIKSDTNQVTVHVSESDDEDEDDEDYESREDLESGAVDGEPRQESNKPFVSRISVIVPIYRRDSQDEVYAGSHKYPGEGVYLLKFDNSYSLWRSKTLYYRVYCTTPCVTKN